MVHESSQILEQRDFLANLLKFCRTKMAGLAKDMGGSFGLSTSTVIDLKGVQVILITAEAPVADVVFVQVLAGFAESLDDGFVRHAVIEHLIDLVAEGQWQASDFAIAARFGLAGLELNTEIVGGRVGELHSYIVARLHCYKVNWVNSVSWLNRYKSCKVTWGADA